MRSAFEALRAAIESDTTQVRENARAEALASLDNLAQLWYHLRRSKQWHYHSSWPASCERTILAHLAPIADWANEMPDFIEPELAAGYAELFNISELIGYSYTGKIKLGGAKVYGLEVWNTRAISFSSSPQLKIKAHRLFNLDTAGELTDYGLHIHPVNKKGRKLNFILLFSPELSGDELLWQPFGDQEDADTNPLRDTLKDKHGRKLLAAVQQAVGEIPAEPEAYGEWATKFRAPLPDITHLAYSAQAPRAEAPVAAIAVDEHITAAKVEEAQRIAAAAEEEENEPDEADDD